MSLYFFHAVVYWLFDPTLVPVLRRYMLTEPEIWGILSTEEMSLLGSHRFPNACEDYSGVVSWLSFAQGVVVLHLQQCMDLKGFESNLLVHVCRDRCRVVRIGSILAPRSVLFCISSIKCNFETLSRDTHREDTVNSVFIN